MKGRMTMILVWGLMIVLAIVIIYLIIPGGPAWKKYLADIASSFQQENDISLQPSVITEEAIAELPQLLRKYLKKNGYINQPMMRNMYIQFENTKFRMEAGKKTIPIDFCQVNFVESTRPLCFFNGTHVWLAGSCERQCSGWQGINDRRAGETFSIVSFHWSRNGSKPIDYGTG